MNGLDNDNNIDLPHLFKNNSCKIEIHTEKITVLKAHSLIRESSNEYPGVLKLKNLINNLIKLNLNMNICYLILEEMQLEKDFNLENTLSLVVEKYFSKDFEDFYLENGSNPKKQKQNIFIKMFNKIQIDEKKNKFDVLKKSNSMDEKNNPHVIIQMASNNDIRIDIKEEIKQEENSKLCEICYENHYYENFFPIIKHNFCKFCLLNYLKNMIFSSNILEIKCPDGCGELLTDEKISIILKFEEDLYSKYLKFKKIYQLNQDPNGTWCVHENCDNFIQCEANSTKVICLKCNKEMCFQCKNIWHPNITCEQALDKDLKNYEEKVQIKKCPKCKSRIEKNEGCNHMTCTRCKYEFCWLCGNKYSSNHFEWYNLCGCPNMQNRNIQDRCLFCKITIEKLFKFLFYIIAAILFITVVYPLGMIIGIFVWPIYLIKKYIPYRITSMKGLLYYFLLLFLAFIIGLILSPIILLLEIVPGICCLIIYINHAGDS